MSTAKVTPWWCTAPSVMTNMKTGATEPFTPPSPAGCLYGAWVSQTSADSTQAAGYARFNTAIGASIQVARTYDFGAGVIANLGQAGIGVIPQIASWNAQNPTALTAVANKSSDATINSILTYITANAAGKTTWLTMNHEFDGKINQSHYTFAQFVPAFERFAELVSDHGDPNINLCLIWVEIVPSRWNAYWPSLTGLGITHHGYDAYQGYLTGSVTQTAQNLMQPMDDIVKSVGLRTLIPETGYRVNSDGSSGTTAQKAAYCTSLGAMSTLVDACCYFDGGGTLGNTTISNIPTAATAYGALI